MNLLTQNQREKLAAFHKLPGKEKTDIWTAIVNLEQMRIEGRFPSPDEIYNSLSATGHIEIGLACYVAQLSKNKWNAK